MTDKLNELGKSVRQDTDSVTHALTRTLRQPPLVERSRDIFDNVVPFEMVFNMPKNLKTGTLDLRFSYPPTSKSTCCCSDCYCGQCEYFFVSTPILTTTYPYISGTVHVYVKINTEQEIFKEDDEFEETDPTTITLNFTPQPTWVVKACYIYKIDSEGCP